MKKTLLLVLSIVMITTIANSQTKEDKKELKQEKKEKNYEGIKTLINSGAFVFESNLLTTSRGREVGIDPHSNGIVVENGSSAGSLQYYGEVTSIGANDDGGIEFNNVAENYNVKFNDKKMRIDISFNVKGTSDHYSVSMSISENGDTYVDISCSSKSNITYSGAVGAIEKK